MKTTFDIPEPLLRDVQKLAREHKTTTKSLVEQALRKLLDDHATAEPFVLRDASVDGDGLSPEFAAATWDEIRDAAYGLPR